MTTGFAIYPYGHTANKVTYESLKAQLKNRDSKKLENNTYIVRLNDSTVAIKLHDTNILAFTYDSVRLYSGGYRTVTTKARLNAYAPVGVYAHNGLWYAGESLFYEGITFDYTGKLLTEQKIDIDTKKQSAAMKRRIKTYVDLCIEKIQEGIELPGASDCWYCLMKNQDGVTMGDMSSSDNHLESHMEESYVVPSLVLNAMREAGYSEKQFYLLCGYGSTQKSGEHRIYNYAIRLSLRKYLVKRLITDQLP